MMRDRLMLAAVAFGASAFTATAMTFLDAGGAIHDVATAQVSSGREVRVVVPETVGEAGVLELPVVTEAFRQTNLHARVTGTVSSRHADLGDRVAAGETLAIVDIPEIRRERERASATRRQAMARRRLARSELARAEALVDRGFVSQAVLDEKHAKAEVAAADEQAAAADVARLDELLALRLVRAPFAGTVSFRGVERGDLVTPNANAAPLFVVAETDRLRVVAEVPQSALARVGEGMPVALFFDELGTKPVFARIARRSMSVDQKSGTVRVEMVLDNAGLKLPAGAAGTMHVQSPVAASTLLLPNNAIVTRKGKPHVALVQGGKVRFAGVVLGRNLGARSEVGAGLDAGARVIVNPNAMLQDGDAVKAGKAPPGTTYLPQ